MAFATLLHKNQQRIAIRHDDAWVLLPVAMGDMVALIEGGAPALAQAREYGRAAQRERVPASDAWCLETIDGADE